MNTGKKREPKARNPDQETSYRSLLHMFSKNKDGFDLVADWVAKRLLQRIDKSISSSNAALENLRAVFMANVSFATSHPELPRIMLSNLKRSIKLKNKIIDKLLQAYKKRLKELFLKAVEQNELPDSLDVNIAVTVFLGTVQGLVLQSILLNSHELIQKEADRVFEYMIAGFLTGNDAPKTTTETWPSAEEIQFILNEFKN